MVIFHGTNRPQVRLNALCMRIAKRPLEKGETLYDTQQIGVGKDPGAAPPKDDVLPMAKRIIKFGSV